MNGLFVLDLWETEQMGDSLLLALFSQRFVSTSFLIRINVADGVGEDVYLKMSLR